MGIRQADLARDVGITRQTIIAIEKGRLNPSVVICLKIARLLREPVDYIFYLEPGWEVESASSDAVAPREARPKASTRVRVSAKKIEKPKIEEGAERTLEADAVESETPAPSIGRDRDAEAGVEEDTASRPEPGPAASEAPSKAVAEKGDSDEPETPVGTEKQGQAIWDFF